MVRRLILLTAAKKPAVLAQKEILRFRDFLQPSWRDNRSVVNSRGLSMTESALDVRFLLICS